MVSSKKLSLTANRPSPRLTTRKPGLNSPICKPPQPLELREQVARKTYHCTLLKGVTGSGKTEVYMEAVAECLKQGRQALILLPEIALSVSFVQRFQDRFGALPAQWHSGVSPPLRRQCWRGVADGQGWCSHRGALRPVSAVQKPWADCGG